MLSVEPPRRASQPVGVELMNKLWMSGAITLVATAARAAPTPTE
jgi:hypothetical protein